MSTHEEFFSIAFYRTFLFNSLRIVFLLVLAWIATVVARGLLLGVRKYAVQVMLRAGAADTQSEIEKRAETVVGVVRKTLVSSIWVIALIMILKEMNFDVRPLLAGAGVFGVALGFGAQSLIKDVLGGFFLLLENQIRVNDVVNINGQGGLVEEINLRTTLLRSDDGAVHVFTNGNIQKIANLTRDFSYYVFNISVPYGTDVDRAMEVLRSLGAELMSEDKFRGLILAPLEIWGVDQLGDSSILIKSRFKTMPMQQWTVGREMNRRVPKAFADAGIRAPLPARAVMLELPAREDIRQIVREVLAETRPAV